MMKVDLGIFRIMASGLVLGLLSLGLAHAAPPASDHITIEGQRIVWKGDLDGMIKRRIVRVLLPYNKTLYFLDKGGQQRGLMYDMMTAFEQDLNQQLATKHLKIQFIFVPTPRDQLIPELIAGRGDIIAADLTITPERQKLIEFSTPLASGIKEVIVTSANDPGIKTLEDLSGKTVFVNPSTSYAESLKLLNASLQKQKKASIIIKNAPGTFETEDILEMANANLVPITVSDLYLARFWKNIFPNIQIHENLVLHSDGSVAFGFRKNSPELKKALDSFTEKNKIGSSFGNQKLQTYLKSLKWVKNATNPADLKKFHSLAKVFQKYGDQYHIDWLLMTAQGYQESRLDQNKKSKVGAIGVMQIMPATGKDLKVGDINNVDNNINGGVKYIRYLIEQYYGKEQMTDLNKVLFAFAAYNAGPTRIAQLRIEAGKRGLNPNIWFDNVERIAAERIGSETVQYVSNIYKYSVAYKLVTELPSKSEQAK
jgi:membrane-bound lytic murein transglycosylase MltF